MRADVVIPYLAGSGARVAQAERNDDSGTLETLQTEQYAILSQLQKDLGKNSKARVLTDESKSRKNVRQAISRDIKRIAEHHAKLAELPKFAFKGNAMCYSPADDPAWGSDDLTSSDAHHVKAERAHCGHLHDKQRVGDRSLWTQANHPDPDTKFECGEQEH